VPLVALLVRSWNLFHGNASPPRRRSHLREMITLAAGDEPDVLCLQEIPVWAVGKLGRWSGMHEFPAIARPGLPTVRLAGWATRLHNGLLRSAIAGQANVILVSSSHTVQDLGSEKVSSLGLERRVCQGVRLDGELVVVNTHLSNLGEGQRDELLRTLEFAETIVRPGEPLVLAGDFNLNDAHLVGFSAPGPGIDHVLVRGADASPLAVWTEERRRQNGIVLSDHAPVEVRVG
jgi:endonuclease/exonuclease/phosphatase family metal-dependent hydrolase